DAVDRGADRERLAVAVGDQPAVRGNFLGAQVARVRLLVQELAVEYLQVHGAGAEHRRRRGEEREHERGTQDEPPLRLLPGFGAALHARSITKISSGRGRARERSSAATRSMRAWVAQVLCSICSCPHAMFSSSRPTVSASSSTNSLRASYFV